MKKLITPLLLTATLLINGCEKKEQNWTYLEGVSIPNTEQYMPRCNGLFGNSSYQFDIQTEYGRKTIYVIDGPAERTKETIDTLIGNTDKQYICVRSITNEIFHEDKIYAYAAYLTIGCNNPSRQKKQSSNLFHNPEMTPEQYQKYIGKAKN